MRLAGPCPSAQSPFQAFANPEPAFPLPDSSRVLREGLRGIHCPVTRIIAVAGEVCAGLQSSRHALPGPCRLRAACIEPAPTGYLHQAARGLHRLCSAEDLHTWVALVKCLGWGNNSEENEVSVLVQGDGLKAREGKKAARWDTVAVFARMMSKVSLRR